MLAIGRQLFNSRCTKLFLDESTVHELLRIEELIPAMEAALARFSAGGVVQPVRVMLPVAQHEGFLGIMPAYCGAVGVKLVTMYPKNEGVPTHHAIILLFRPESGELLATLEGRLITEMRTAAVSAVATKYLARPDASVLGILGTGAQASSHLPALQTVGKFRDVRVWSPTNASSFAERFGVRAAASAEETVRGADVVVVATGSRVPVLSGRWLSPGVHINAVGAVRPEWRELDDEALHRARLYVDSRESALRESGDVIAAGRVFAEIGEVIGGVRPGLGARDEVTLFKSVGLAVEDVVTADLVYRKAIARS